MTILEQIRNYFITCPHLDPDALINIYKVVKETNNYSLDPVTAELVIKEDILGNKTKQFRFYFTTVERCDTLEQELAVQQLLSDVLAWIEEQNELKNYPTPQGTKIKVDNTPDLFSKDPSLATGVYQILITYTYLERND